MGLLPPRVADDTLGRMPETYLTVREAAERLNLGDQRIRDLIKAGRLRAAWREDTRTWQVLEEDVQNFKPRPGGRPRKSTG
jgi:excisionase family DNA binding protein